MHLLPTLLLLVLPLLLLLYQLDISATAIAATASDAAVTSYGGFSEDPQVRKSKERQRKRELRYREGQIIEASGHGCILILHLGG